MYSEFCVKIIILSSMLLMLATVDEYVTFVLFVNKLFLL